MSKQEGNTHPSATAASQLAKLLDGMLIQHDPGLAMSVIRRSATFEPVFNSDEIATLAPLLSRGLKQADPSQRVGFTFWSSTPGRGYAPFSGAVSVRDPYLIFALKTHPGSDWRDPENPPPPSLFALDFRQDSYLKPGSEEERRGSYKARPMLQIDYRRYLSALQDQSDQNTTPVASTPAAMPAPSASSTAAPRASQPDLQTINELQRQVKELTQDLIRLRHELVETEQLLADKVLELNRSKPAESGSNQK